MARRQTVARRRTLHDWRLGHDHHAPLPAAHRHGCRIPQPRRLPPARRSASGLPAGLIRSARNLPRAPTRRSYSMTYFEGFIVPVPEANLDAYKKHASEFAPLVQDIGVRRMVESWGSDVPEGK